MCSTSAFCKLTGVPPEDILFLNYRNRTHEVCYVVFLDHATHSVVISIRGSGSLADVMTDLNAVHDCFSTDDIPNCAVHK
ncbi:unnamed protein product, partial [Cyprideis torosa]